MNNELPDYHAQAEALLRKDLKDQGWSVQQVNWQEADDSLYSWRIVVFRNHDFDTQATGFAETLENAVISAGVAADYWTVENGNK